MNSIDELGMLAELLRQLNDLGMRISQITQRPATIGHTGEFIASKIFNIQLQESASSEAIDGHFQSGPLKGSSVNVKWYAKHESILDITPDSLPDYYLVMAGPKSTTMSSKGGVRPWIIDTVHLFNAEELVARLRDRGVKIGIASSVRRQDWEDFQIYPIPSYGEFQISEAQMELLKLFRSK
jgi:hypothetical protein